MTSCRRSTIQTGTPTGTDRAARSPLAVQSGYELVAPQPFWERAYRDLDAATSGRPSQEFSDLIYAGARDKLALAKKERIKRLKAMAEKMTPSPESEERHDRAVAGKQEFQDKIPEVCELFTGETAPGLSAERMDPFLEGFHGHKKDSGGSYLEVVQTLPSAVSQEGTKWLQQIIDDLCIKSAAMMPSLRLFNK